MLVSKQLPPQLRIPEPALICYYGNYSWETKTRWTTCSLFLKLHPVTCQLPVKMKHCQYKIEFNQSFCPDKGKGESIKKRGGGGGKIGKFAKTLKME